MGRFFAALLRFFTFGLLRSSEDIRNAANAKFTDSAAGIRAGFQIERDQRAKEMVELEGAVADILTIHEQRKTKLSKLDEEEQRLEQQAAGALELRKRSAEGSADFVRADAACVRYDARLDEITKEHARLVDEVALDENKMNQYMARLTDMKAELEHLREEGAETEADFIISKKRIEIDNRLMNALNSTHEGPVNAIRERVQSLRSQAMVTEKLSGTDSRIQDAEFARAGRDASAADSLEARLAARKAQRAAVTTAPQTDAPVAVSSPTDRAKI